MVDDHRQRRVALRQLGQQRQVARTRRDVEPQAVPRERVERWPHVVAQDPARVLDEAEHRPHALDDAVRREVRNRNTRVVRGQIDPPHDTAHQAAGHPRDVDQRPRLGHRGRRLHEHRCRNVAQHGAQVFQPVIAVDGGRMVEPRIIVPSDPPEVLMRVHQPRFEGRRVRHFTAPSASPRTRCFCSAIMNRTIGIMMAIAAAADSDQ